MEEIDGGIRLNFPDGTNEVFTRKKMELRTYFGKLAIYDHVFLRCDDERGMVVFDGEPLYKPLVEFVLKNNYPMLMNMVNISDGIKEVYEEDAKRGFGDTFPEEWVNE